MRPPELEHGTGVTTPANCNPSAPPAIAEQDTVGRIVAIMARLRDPEHGCEWDCAQTFATIASYTIEEAYEVADAIERGDIGDLKDELGDLLLQVVFHSRIAEEAGHFDLRDVVDAISDKMERRHPHIFGDAEVGGHHLWEQVKATERRQKPGQDGALAGVALGLPALARAEELQKRAGRVGFDWPDATGPRNKIDEELVEIAQATTDAERFDEVGDLLFSVVNWARHLGVDAEAALRSANGKFERRFSAMEAEDATFADRTLIEQEAAWRRAKAAE
ncbi:nucleoside triphosphate pyrophosphohydrolase [Sphingomonas sp. Leaf22]|uniref:nucleoside triphosphate pyrophosphohydrolase n=1 Tax=Sphingomonas sp. Leaf22 TaxID=1735687 RepID=UPI0009E777C9|nr:nucleoside triphosphate pyrophosphohydrolase [Sphingomonas sp. Leaf22]